MMLSRRSESVRELSGFYRTMCTGIFRWRFRKEDFKGNEGDLLKVLFWSRQLDQPGQDPALTTTECERVMRGYAVLMTSLFPTTDDAKVQQANCTGDNLSSDRWTVATVSDLNVRGQEFFAKGSESATCIERFSDTSFYFPKIVRKFIRKYSKIHCKIHY